MDDGPQKVIQAAEDLGIPGNDGGAVGHPAPSVDLQENVGVTLGTAQVSPINMANAYATLANGGTRNEVHVVQKVVDKRRRDPLRGQGRAARRPSTPTSPPT